MHLYLPGPLRGVWNAAALAAKEVIVCEALIDAMTFWCAGYRNVMAAFGVKGFTADHWAALKQHGTQRVWIAYDRDEAGNAAAEKLAERLTAEGIECYGACCCPRAGRERLREEGHAGGEESGGVAGRRSGSARARRAEVAA